MSETIRAIVEDEVLLDWRSQAAALWDLANDGGTKPVEFSRPLATGIVDKFLTLIRELRLLREAARPFANLECECDSYHGYRCNVHSLREALGLSWKDNSTKGVG